MSGFDITGINFSNQADSFKVEIDLDKITATTSKTLKQININIEDGISKQEAEDLITQLDADESLIIDEEEINAFASNKGLQGKENEIKFILENIIEEAKKASAEDAQNNESSTADTKITVQKWGSLAADGNKYANDSLSHIMANNYPDLQPNTQEWQDKMLEIMNANPKIYGTVDSEGNITGARKSVGGEGRQNAVLYENDEIILPGISTTKTEESKENESLQETEKEEETEESAETTGEVTTREDGTTDTIFKNDNNLEIKKEHRDANGNILDSIEYEYNNNSVKTKETQSIFDENQKIKESTTFIYAEDGKTVLEENAYKYKDGSDAPYPAFEKVYNSDRSYQLRTYKDDGKFISAVYNADGTIQSGTEKYYDSMGNEITKEVYEQE